jgi:hypothetical protein
MCVMHVQERLPVEVRVALFLAKLAVPGTALATMYEALSY